MEWDARAHEYVIIIMDGESVCVCHAPLASSVRHRRAGPGLAHGLHGPRGVTPMLPNSPQLTPLISNNRAREISNFAYLLVWWRHCDKRTGHASAAYETRCFDG